MGLHLADYVVNETGFAADLGAEKFFDLVMPMCGHVPSVAVVIVTLKALRAQGGSPDGPVDRGFPNLARHSDNVRRWGVAAGRRAESFPGRHRRRSRAGARLLPHRSASRRRLSEGYGKGGEGMTRPGGEDRRRGGSRPIPSKSSRSTAPISAFEQKITESPRRSTARQSVAFKPAAKTAARNDSTRSATARCRSASPRPSTRSPTTPK